MISRRTTLFGLGAALATAGFGAPASAHHRNQKTYVVPPEHMPVEVRISKGITPGEIHLDPNRFYRIHRSTIVQLDRVEALLTAPGGDYAVRLADGTRLGLSRSRRDAFMKHLGFEQSS